MINSPNTPENTELSPDELGGLIPSLASKQELNEFERENILAAEEWAFSPRQLKQCQPWTETYVRDLHAKMFGETWKWAGTYRDTQKNIGIPYWEIPDQIAVLLGDAGFWIQNNTYDADDIAVRLHHRLVYIHPFPNGNGRHARLIADVMAVKSDRNRFTWGSASLLAAVPTRDLYITALKAADLGEIQPLLKFARS